MSILPLSTHPPATPNSPQAQMKNQATSESAGLPSEGARVGLQVGAKRWEWREAAPAEEDRGRDKNHQAGCRKE